RFWLDVGFKASLFASSSFPYIRSRLSDGFLVLLSPIARATDLLNWWLDSVESGVKCVWL
ncbi:hypothetical protein ISN45_Aa01g022780, partial [Arabidopsis thaliana x Arabidopsis arenosa]